MYILISDSDFFHYLTVNTYVHWTLEVNTLYKIQILYCSVCHVVLACTCNYFRFISMAVFVYTNNLRSLFSSGKDYWITGIFFTISHFQRVNYLFCFY